MLGTVPNDANPGNYERAAAEFLRALRGQKSQRWMARRLGYRANPVTDWEHGRRFPTAEETLRVAQRAGIDVKGAFDRFHQAPLREESRGKYDLSGWLDAVRGSTPVRQLAARAGVSPFAAGRWLRGDAKPRLPHFLRLLDASTGRMPEFVALFVDIGAVPSLKKRFDAAESARRVAYDAPWTEAILRVLESEQYRGLRRHDNHWIAERLGLSSGEVRDSIALLARAGTIERRRGLFRGADMSSVDTRGEPERARRLLEHWCGVARSNCGVTRSGNLLAYNVCGLSRDDYERVRELLRRTFREVRSIVAASEPTERVALLNLQFVSLMSDEA
jgi:DNA-binding Lrp family transcriptional regulator